MFISTGATHEVSANDSGGSLRGVNRVRAIILFFNANAYLGKEK
jgi:hypothetical protein